MWICSKLGFYSIVQKEDAWHVRARTRKDLKNLVTQAELHTEIQEWPGADYRWRILVKHHWDMETVFRVLLESIDYSNFKGRISADPDQGEKAGAYGRFWGDMCRIQSAAEDVQQD